jgi:signal transduction histidine kinase
MWLKQFMGSAITFGQISKQSFPNLGWRLLLAYLIAMASIFGLSETALYIFFSSSLEHQLERQLLTLAQAAVPNLETVKTRGRQSLDRTLPWRSLFSEQEQSLEWFDANGQLLAKEGSIFPKTPLVKEFSSLRLQEGSPVFQQHGQVRSVTITVYADESDENLLRLEGYIRASESTQEISAELERLRLLLWLGGSALLMIVGVSNIYLTRAALKPTLESFGRLKQFAADASHELRNPLTRISVATETILIRAEQFSPSDIRKLAIVTSGVEQMKRLVEDLLFLTRIDAMAESDWLEGSPILLNELLEDLAEQLKPQAQRKRINFQVRLSADLWVKGDPNQLNRLLINLLENAFKYTREGGRVTLSLKKLRQSVAVSVEDTGIGIASEQLPFVFQRFWRAKSARQQEGLGLGLAIAQSIAKGHGGEITLKSQIGVGTCFQVRLPLAEPGSVRTLTRKGKACLAHTVISESEKGD